MSSMVNVLTMVVILLVMVILWYFVRKASYAQKFPPSVGNCPDYWEDLTGDGSACYNKKKIGTCPPASYNDTYDKKAVMNMKKFPFDGPNSMCAKYTWASNCGLTWDGLTYGYGTKACSTVDKN